MRTPEKNDADRQRSPTAIMQTNSSMCLRVRINVVGVVLSINDRRKRVSGRGLCEPFTKTNVAPGPHNIHPKSQGSSMAERLRASKSVLYNFRHSIMYLHIPAIFIGAMCSYSARMCLFFICVIQAMVVNH